MERRIDSRLTVRVRKLCSRRELSTERACDGQRCRLTRGEHNCLPTVLALPVVLMLHRWKEAAAAFEYDP